MQPQPQVSDQPVPDTAHSPQFIDANVDSDSDYETSDAEDSEYQDDDAEDGEYQDDETEETEPLPQRQNQSTIPENSVLVQSKFKGTKLDYFYRKNKEVWV